MRYILKSLKNGKYLQYVNEDSYFKFTDDPSKATVYSESMLEEKRQLISKKAKAQKSNLIEVIRVI